MNSEKRITRRWKPVQVGDDNASEGGIEIAGQGEAREIGMAAVVVIGHVHPAVEHYPLPVHRHYHAALPDFLPSAWNRNRKQKVRIKNVIRDHKNSSREIVDYRERDTQWPWRDFPFLQEQERTLATLFGAVFEIWLLVWLVGFTAYVGYLNVKSTVVRLGEFTIKNDYITSRDGHS